jgi:hypothetical protein
VPKADKSQKLIDVLCKTLKQLKQHFRCVLQVFYRTFLIQVQYLKQVLFLVGVHLSDLNRYRFEALLRKDLPVLGSLIRVGLSHWRLTCIFILQALY